VFKGTYRYRIDGKGRLPVPAAFRKALAGQGAEAVVATFLDQCLAVYPPSEWMRLEDRLRALPSFGRTTRALTRSLLSRASDCALDVQGRILVPPALRQAAGLEREVAIVGALDRFEVWAPDAWDRFLSESERLLDDASLDVPWPPPGGPSTGKP
jgi:MraZ protein